LKLVSLNGKLDEPLFAKSRVTWCQLLADSWALSLLESCHSSIGVWMLRLAAQVNGFTVIL
jgi:hypothetical protein